MLHNFQGKLSVLCNGLAIVEPLQLIQCCNAEGSCHGFQQGLDFVRRLEVTAIYATLTVHDRVGTGFHLTQIFIGTLVNPSNHFQVVVQDFIEVTAFGSGFCQNHRQV